MVGDMARDEHEEERRQELREADEPEVERTPGQRVDLPADGDGEHLVRDHREYAREPEQHERALAHQCRLARARRTNRRHCAAPVSISVNITGIDSAAIAVVSTIADAIAPDSTPNCRDIR